jgi:hypothetical protein
MEKRVEFGMNGFDFFERDAVQGQKLRHPLGPLAAHRATSFVAGGKNSCIK